MKITSSHIFNGDGSITITDGRDFFDCKTFALQQIKKQAMEKIYEIAPDFKQRNAALGLLSQQETDEIKNHIENIRNASNIKEAEIMAIEWDGTEETRSAACDAVLNIRLN